MKLKRSFTSWLLLFSLLSAGSLLLAGCSDDSDDGNGGGDTPDVPQIFEPVANPYLASPLYSITHFNSAQTDAFPYAVKSGTFNVNPDDCQGGWSGPVNLMTLSSTNPDYMWGMSSDRVSYIHIADGKFERVAECPLANGIKQRTEEQLRRLVASYNSVDELTTVAEEILGARPQLAMMSGNYVLCDKDNYVYTNAGFYIARYCLKNPANPAEGIKMDRSLDMSAFMGNQQPLVGLVMTYDGHLVVAARNGIAVIDRQMSMPPVMKMLPEGQTLSNSVAVDEHNGIYLASNSTTSEGKGLMQKLVWTGNRLSDDPADGAWKANYDGGPEAPAIKMGFGTGSTPTLMGFGDNEDKLVVITDGAQRMKIVAFWRDEIPEDAVPVPGADVRVAGQHEVTCGLPASTEWIQSEQSVVVSGYGAFVVNNVVESPVSDKIVGVLSLGPLVTPPSGVERLEWDTKSNQWNSVWTRADVHSLSMIPAVSTPSNMVFINGYTSSDGLDVTGLDWNSGSTLHRMVFGHNNRGNGAYAILQYLENGDLLFNSVTGPFRVAIK